jgi:hypothetical protein
MKQIKVTCNYFLLFISSLFFISCTGSTSPNELPSIALLSAPEILSIEGKHIKLSTDIILNLEPISSPNPSPNRLMAIIYLETVDSTIIPEGIDFNKIYIIKDQDVWDSTLNKEEHLNEELGQDKIAAIARYGPHWGPNIYVDVVVNFKSNGKNYLIKSKNQFVGAAY